MSQNNRIRALLAKKKEGDVIETCFGKESERWNKWQKEMKKLREPK